MSFIEKEKQMSRYVRSILVVVSALGAAIAAGPVVANDIAQIKVANGTVIVERGSQRLMAAAGTRLQQSDVVRTGINGSAGITFTDNTMMSIGPNSVIALDRYSFNSTTHEGRLDTAMRSGTLSVVSGKIAKQSPDAMTVKTPATILGVRGTEFLVQVGETK
jgi:hypothetical protein